MSKMIVINDSNYKDYTDPDYAIGGIKVRRGLKPRNMQTHPPGCYSFAAPFDNSLLIPESEWEDRLAAKIAAKAQMSDIRNIMGPNGGPIPSTDQNGRGYCWCHSGVSANLMVRALNNQPYVPLSAYMIGCLVKDYQDEGGWGLEGIEFQVEHGVPSEEFWPQQSTKRSNDTPAMRENAKLHRVIEWMELDSRNMKAQLISCLLQNLPVVSDFNWWGHSVLTSDLMSVRNFSTKIWNSWGDEWSENGMGILEGSKALPDDAVAARVIYASTI